MMAVLRLLIVVCAATGLAGCFSSEESLIGPDEAVFPYETIVWSETLGSEPITMTRDGNAYRFRPSEADSDGLLRFMPVDDGYHLAELVFTESGTTHRLYALLKVDFEAKVAESYAAMAPTAGLDGDGFVPCEEGTCITDRDAYIVYAKEIAEKGWPPNNLFRLISWE